MKAQKYLEELIDQEQDYLLGYDEGEKPQQHIDRLKDLKEALTEVKNCSIPDVVGQGEQLKNQLTKSDIDYMKHQRSVNMKRG